MCGLEITHQDGKILAIKGDKNDPFSRGHICPKAVALQDIYHDPNRLKHPVRRTADGWERIGWDEAFDEVVQNLKAVQAKYGNNAVGVYQGNPNVHNMGSILYNAPFVRTLRTRNRFSATSVDQLPHHFAALFMFGHQFLTPIPDIDRTDYMLILGANPVVSNGSFMTAAGVKRRLQAIQKRNGKVVVIDPRRSETGEMADEHHFIRPGTDVLFLLSLVNVLFTDGLVKVGEWSSFCDGLGKLETAVQSFSPEVVSVQTGVQAETIRRVAHEFAGAERAVCYGRMGVSTQAFGGVVHWLINVINIVTGNLDKAGGAMFTKPAFDVVGILAGMGSNGSYNRFQSRVRGLPEFGGELPVAGLAEEILTEGEGQIRAMVVNAGNPVLSTPNGSQLDTALAGLEFMVAIDIYINETTRHANIILPPATGLETDHYDLVFHILAVQNSAKYSEPLFEKEPDALYDWQIFQALRKRMMNGQTRGKGDIFWRWSPEKIVNLGLRYGPYGKEGVNGTADKGSLSLRVLRDNPHGVDLGALKPCLPERLATADKRINLAPDLLVADLERVKAELLKPTAVNGFEFSLIGRRHLRSNNSWMHNSERLLGGTNRCTVLVNPSDAKSLGLTEGEQVYVESRVGRVVLPVEVSDEMMMGVVSIPHGWGHDKEGVMLEVARENAGISINDLTDHHRLDTLTGNTAFSGVPVRVTRKTR
jgi:anaerobic selenocysteine-containing dehydrogenase